MKNKISEFFNVTFPIVLLITAIVFIFIDELPRAALFVALYAVYSISVNLRDIDKGINNLWYLIYLRNKHDGIE
ncbi:hypothetical protein [Enterococcus dongliensis]|uniref:hypothetical protein n=1 Tax=Enterococcus dongliensis TaxID=2559925 RepID=UPI00288F3D35|nr:hypothetical protein [Enterococcus dongliensis]MDT2669981.1 hypothetical protein [Enterococcus dongliensis]